MIDYTLPLEKLPDPLPIEPLRKPFDVTITPPGSKSITNRAYVLAALAKGESRIIRPLRADDTDLLLKALCTLGAEARWAPGGEDVFIKGVNGRFPCGGHVNLGDGGTPTRFMIACACLAAEPVVVDGSKRMRERPIAEGVDMLRQLGARIEYVEAEGRLPVRVVPKQEFQGGSLAVGKAASSQFISALLLIGPALPRGLALIFAEPATSPAYIQLTLHLLQQWWEQDAPSRVSPLGSFWRSIDGILPHEVVLQPAHQDGKSFVVESDASSAVPWVVATWLNPPSRSQIYRFNMTPCQPDLHVIRLLKYRNLLNVELSYTPGEPCRWRLSRGRKTGKLKDDAGLYPDGVMTVIAGAAVMKGKSVFTGLRTLRVKETDRIAALAAELGKVGCEVETGEDWISIDPRRGSPTLRVGSAGMREDDSTRKDNPPDSESRATGSDPVIIETYNDHRMAMSFAVLGLARPGLSIRNPACVRKSYPTFWQDFAKLYQ